MNLMKNVISIINLTQKFKEMKKLSFTLIAIVLLLFFNSCGINYATIVNQNQNSTEVHLSSNNYQVVDKVSGSAEVNYVLIFGGVKRKQLYENAYAKMLDAANLISSSKAIVNLVTEEHLGGVPPFYYTRTITVSAYVVEFTK